MLFPARQQNKMRALPLLCSVLATTAAGWPWSKPPPPPPPPEASFYDNVIVPTVMPAATPVAAVPQSPC